MSGSIKFSFKSLEEDEEDEENLTSVTGELDRQVSMKRSSTLDEKSSSPINISRAKEDSRPPRPLTAPRLSDDSRSPKSSIATRSNEDSKPPRLQAGSRSFEEDKISSLTSKFRSNFTDIKAKVVRKIEDIQSELKSSPENESEKTISDHIAKQDEVLKSEDLEVEINVHSKDNESPDHTDSVSKGRERTPSDSGQQEEFQMVDDFYESVDVTSAAVADSPIPVTPEIRYRNKSLPQKLKPKRKATSVVTSGPVSLSNIQQHTIVSDDYVEIVKDKETKEDVFHEVVNDTKVSTPRKNTDSSPEGSSNAERVPWKNIGIASVLVTLYWLIPLPSYISGLLMGTFLTSLCSIAYIKLTKPPKPRPEPEILPLHQLPPFVIPEMKEVKTEDYVFRGWMNEISAYDPFKYSINDTHVVQVLLDGSKLRLRRTKANIPKRAVWDESIPNVTEFVHGRHFDIKDSKVYLLPEGLVQKRLWSKKYPICIELSKKQKANPKGEVTHSDQNKTGENFHGFELINEDKCEEVTLYLFTRTCREKEDWYKRFQAAATGKPLKSNLGQIRKFFETKKHHRQESSDSLTESQNGNGLTHGRKDSVESMASTPSVEAGMWESQDVEHFVRYMSRLMPREKYDRFTPGSKRGAKDPGMIECDEQVLWVNALISRCFWDFLRHPMYSDMVMVKLQRKLEKIKVPYFIENLKMTNISLGTVMPVIRKASRPYFDEDGLWVNMALNYEGGFKMTIETKVNLMKLREVELKKAEREIKASKKLAFTDENEEDSAESTTDEEEENTLSGSTEEGGKKKFMNILGKITQSKYFKSATEIKYVKKAMEGVSNTPLILTVEVRFLSGELALNIPFPPTDRLWYGFKGNPKLSLVAKPKVGAREVTVTYITEWIEKKLATEFQRVVVMPNMDDLIVPILLPESSLSPPSPRPTETTQPET